MKINQNKIDDLNLEITLEVEAADYAAIQKKKFNEVRRTADFKGFRKGMVPASLIQKVYGERILVEAVNEVVGENLEKYIREQNLNIIGEPLNSEKQPELEWADGKDYTFIFDVAMAPIPEFEVEKSDEIPQYNVTVSAKDKAPMIENLKKFYTEKNEEKSDDDIEKEVSERLKDQYHSESEWRVNKDIRDFYIKKSGIKLPEDFLKRWLEFANQGKFTKEDIEKEFPAFAEDFKWQIVRGYLMKKWDLKIEQKDITDAAEAYVTYQYAMYGMSNLPAEILTDAVNNVLKDSKQVDRLIEQVEDEKVLTKVKETATLKSTKISAAKFREL